MIGLDSDFMLTHWPTQGNRTRPDNKHNLVVNKSKKNSPSGIMGFYLFMQSLIVRAVEHILDLKVTKAQIQNRYRTLYAFFSSLILWRTSKIFHLKYPVFRVHTRLCTQQSTFSMQPIKSQYYTLGTLYCWDHSNITEYNYTLFQDIFLNSCGWTQLSQHIFPPETGGVGSIV